MVYHISTSFSPIDDKLFEDKHCPLTKIKEDEIADSAEKMAALMKDFSGKKNPDPNKRRPSTIPAGYTYLAQFIAHDLSFNTTSLPSNSEKTPKNLRSPRLDLDSIYGNSPSTHPHLYTFKKNHVLFKFGKKICKSKSHFIEVEIYDLPKHEGISIIPDPRNDEHLLLSNIHLSFMLYHNQQTKSILGSKKGKKLSPFEIFYKAKKKVLKAYHKIIYNDLLKKLIPENLIKEEAQIIRNRVKIYDHTESFIPLEFSFAAFRFGHSMVKNEYNFPYYGQDETNPESLLNPKKDIGYLNFSKFFFDVRTKNVNFANQITPWITENLNEFPISQFNKTQGLVKINLTKKNLQAGMLVHLQSGQSIAKELNIDKDSIYSVDFLGDLSFSISTNPDKKYYFKEHTPLWLYILYETYLINKEGRKLNDFYEDKLGPVASKIILKVILSLLNLTSDLLSLEKGKLTMYKFLKEELGVENGLVKKRKKKKK